MHPAPQPARRRATAIIGMLLLAALACLLFAGIAGSVTVALPEFPQAVLEVLRGRPDSLAASLLELRAGRALTAFVTGAALALAGVHDAGPAAQSAGRPLCAGHLGRRLGRGAGCDAGAWARRGGRRRRVGRRGAVSMLLYLLARRDCAAAWQRKAAPRRCC